MGQERGYIDDGVNSRLGFFGQERVFYYWKCLGLVVGIKRSEARLILGF